MKNIKKLIMVLVMALVFTGIYLPQSSTAYASSSSNVTKMLSAYKKHYYVTAEKYAKKLTSTKDSSERKMTSSMKKAFKSTLTKKYSISRTESVHFVDMDGDNKAEMLVVYGSCEADLHTYIYKYKNGKAVYVGRFDSGHSVLVNYPGHKGVIVHFGQMGYENISTVCLKNGKISLTNYGTRNIGLGDYLSLKYLNPHMKYDKNYNAKWNLGF